MREIKYKEKTTYITEKDWKILLRRFNEKNANLMVWFTINFWFWEIDIPCPFCEKHADCSGCPFRQFAIKDKSGCTVLMESVLKKKFCFFYFCFYRNKIMWKIEHDKIARKELRKIHDAILALPRK